MKLNFVLVGIKIFSVICSELTGFLTTAFLSPIFVLAFVDSLLIHTVSMVLLGSTTLLSLAEDLEPTEQSSSSATMSTSTSIKLEAMFVAEFLNNSIAVVLPLLESTAGRSTPEKILCTLLQTESDR